MYTNSVELFADGLQQYLFLSTPAFLFSVSPPSRYPKLWIRGVEPIGVITWRTNTRTPSG